MYCLATAKAELNKKLRAISHELFESKLALGASTSTVQREMVAQGNAQVSCLKAAESATAMLSKKFNAKPPTSCK